MGTICADPDRPRYTGKINISFESSVKQAGELITKAMNAGANKIDGFQLNLRTSCLQKLKT